MGVNRIELDTTEGKQVLIDISDSTIKPETVAEGEKGYGADGEPFIGTMSQGGGLDTSDATATPDVVASGYTYYAKGKKQTGKVDIRNDEGYVYYQSDVTEKDVSGFGDCVVATATAPSNYYYRKNVKINIAIKKEKFGDATVSDVIKGKTFTSTAGLKVEGTYEPPVSAGGVSF